MGQRCVDYVLVVTYASTKYPFKRECSRSTGHLVMGQRCVDYVQVKKVYGYACGK